MRTCSIIRCQPSALTSNRSHLPTTTSAPSTSCWASIICSAWTFRAVSSHVQVSTSDTACCSYREQQCTSASPLQLLSSAHSHCPLPLPCCSPPGLPNAALALCPAAPVHPLNSYGDLPPLSLSPAATSKDDLPPPSLSPAATSKDDLPPPSLSPAADLPSINLPSINPNPPLTLTLHSGGRLTPAPRSSHQVCVHHDASFRQPPPVAAPP